LRKKKGKVVAAEESNGTKKGERERVVEKEVRLMGACVTCSQAVARPSNLMMDRSQLFLALVFPL